MDEAISFSHAKSEESRGKIKYLVSVCLELIHNFYKSKISLKDYELGIEIVDSFSEIVEQAKDEIFEKIESINPKSITTEINHASFYSSDKVLEIAEQDSTSLGTGIKEILDIASTKHPFSQIMDMAIKMGRLIVEH